MRWDWNKYSMMQTWSSMLEICAPLKKIGISGFFFMRIFNNGKFIDLATDAKWTQHFLTRFLNEEYNVSTVKKHLAFDLNIDLWSLDKENEFYCDAIKNFNIKDGISITYKQKKYKNIFCFYIKEKSKLESNDLLSQLCIFNNFSEYFLYQFQDVIQKNEKHCFFMPERYQKTFLKFDELENHNKYKSMKIFLSKNPGINFNGFKKLTHQEKKCIYLAGHGFNIVDIARQTKLSKRTVESYINNAKNKTGSRNIVELVIQYHRLNQI